MIPKNNKYQVDHQQIAIGNGYIMVNNDVVYDLQAGDVVEICRRKPLTQINAWGKLAYFITNNKYDNNKFDIYLGCKGEHLMEGGLTPVGVVDRMPESEMDVQLLLAYED